MSATRTKKQKLLALLGKLDKMTLGDNAVDFASLNAVLDHNHQLATSMSLPDDDAYRQSNISGSAIFSNERQFSSTIETLAEQKKSETGSLRIGICIGESHFLSMLPELEKHVDCLLLCDIDSFVMASTAYQIVCAKKAKDYESFKKALISKQHPIIEMNYISMANLSSLYEPHQAMLDPVHQIQNRFASIKDSLSRLPVYVLPMNFFKAEKVRALRDVFLNPEHEAQVTVFNITNLHHYDSNWPMANYSLLIGDKKNKPTSWVSRKQLATALHDLIGKDDKLCHLLYSTVTPWSGKDTYEVLSTTTLTSRISRNMAEYKSATEEECAILKDAHNVCQVIFFFKKKVETKTLTPAEQKQLDITIQQSHDISHSRLKNRIPFFSALIESEKGVGLPPGSYKLAGQPPVLPGSPMWLVEEKAAAPSVK